MAIADRNEIIYGLKLRGWTLQAIGDEFGISRERIRQICVRQERRVKSYETYRELNALADRLHEEKELKFLSNYIEQIKELTK